MKGSALFVFAVTAAFVGFAAAPAPAPVPSPAAVKPGASRRMPRMNRLALEGGLLVVPSTGNVIRVVNAQTRVPAAAVAAAAKSIRETLRLPVTESSAAQPNKGCPMAEAQQALALAKTGVAIVLADDSKSPALLVAPEARWAVVNVAALAADKPTPDVLAARVQKELWRAAAFLLGAANSNFQPCLMRTVTKPADLDASPMLAPCPEPFNKMGATAAELGIEPFRVVTYRQACKEGWAPAPENAAQKAIWDKAKAGTLDTPTKPITIEYKK